MVKFLVLIEFDLPKAEDRYKKYVEFSKKPSPYFEKYEKMGVFKSSSSWADNTGHIISITEYESAADMAKLLDDEEVHRDILQWAQLVDNFRVRFLRPTMKV